MVNPERKAADRSNGGLRYALLLESEGSSTSNEEKCHEKGARMLFWLAFRKS